jgi:NitT/TauT family transport system ATP-binding protein
MTAIAVSVSELCKAFGDKERQLVVLDKISFDLERGSLTTIVGPSGCGKSTLLNVLAGIEKITSGTMQIHADATGTELGYVFQSPRLLPWLTIEQNLLFVRPRNVDEPTYRQRLDIYLEMVGLKGIEHKYPYQLSGGMQQRAGIARALCVEPAVLMMDEPFSHLDEITAEQMRAEMLRIWQETGRTILFVTHDIQEAVELGDRLIMLDYHGHITEDIHISLPRPRSVTDRFFVECYADVVRRFRQIQARRLKELGVGDASKAQPLAA